MRESALLYWRPQKREPNAPTNLRSNRHPIHRWANFIAGYSPEFVSECASDAGLNRCDVVLDPFNGLWTALTQALLDGFFIRAMFS